MLRTWDLMPNILKMYVLLLPKYVTQLAIMSICVIGEINICILPIRKNLWGESIYLYIYVRRSQKRLGHAIRKQAPNNVLYLCQVYFCLVKFIQQSESGRPIKIQL